MIVRVPASSANLGPGFDSFGLAWKIYNEIEFLFMEEGLTISGCDERYCGEDNLAYVAYVRTMERCGRKTPGLQIRFLKTEIPVSRGLGSSAALITAGVTVANAMNALGLSKEELLDVATSVEGHPDNIAPALYGGLTASLMEGSHAVTRSFPLSDKLCFTLLIPPFELSTALSRSVMPKEVGMRDAVFNLSRTALLPRALADGDAELLRLALDDRLHQPYRFPLIEGAEIAKQLANDCGAISLCISGAGSTLLCVANDAAFAGKMKRAISEACPTWLVLEAQPDDRGAALL